MKIGPLDSKPPGPVATERKAGPAPTSSPPVPSTEVALSPAATSLANAANAANAAHVGKGMPPDSPFDSAKVDRIAGAIRDGKFTVNAEAIADKLIINAQELLGRKFN